jgi:hypothetical protein
MLAQDIVAPGGPSAPVWAFLSAISLAIIGLIGAEFKSRREMRGRLNDAKSNAEEAANSAKKAQANTAALSNGFAGRMDTKLDTLIDEQRKQGNALRQHLEWHLEGKDK